MTAAASPPLRVICLHGYTQNATVFRARCGSIKHECRRLSTFTYIDAPLLVQPGENKFVPTVSEDDARTWWRYGSVSPDAPQTYSEVTGSVAVLREAFAREGPFQGLFGFSQGACLVGLLCQLSSLSKRARLAGTSMASLLPAEIASAPSLQPLLELDYSFLDSVRFALLFSGFIPRDASYRRMYLHLRDNSHLVEHIATLHVFGSRDRNIEVPLSQELMTCFLKPEHLLHEGGHLVPSNKEQRQCYLAFLEKAATAGVERPQTHAANTTVSSL